MARIAHPLSILLTEDDSLTRLLLTRMLERMGHRVRSVGLGKESVLLAQHATYGLILMDVGLPDQDGMTCARQIRASPGPSQACPIILLTGYDAAQLELTAAERPFQDHLVKPITLERLAQVVQRHTPPGNALPDSTGG